MNDEPTPGGMRFEGARLTFSVPGQGYAVALFFASGDAGSRGSLLRIMLEAPNALDMLELLKALLIRSPYAVIEGGPTS